MMIGRKTRAAGLWGAASVLGLFLALGPPAMGAEPTGGVVNINAASEEELTRLPGVGVARAGAIVALREDRGGFVAIEELTDVDGIGPALLARIRPFVRLEGETATGR
jgi:competence protein ComEA